MKFFIVWLYSLPILLIFLLFNHCKHTPTEIPKAKNGLVDLNNWDFNRYGAVDLNGEWAFYWNEFVPPKEFQKEANLKNHYFIVPSVWNDYTIHNQKINCCGYATFRLKISGLQPYQNYGIKLLSESSSYRLYIDNLLITEVGKPSKNPEESIPKMLSHIVEFIPQNKDIDMVVHISNYTHRSGGLWNKITLGKRQQLHKIRENNLLFDFFLFGSLVIMALYHFGLFLLRKKDLGPFYFGVFCLIVGLRIPFGEEKMYHEWFTNIPWIFLLKYDIVTSYLSIPPFILFCSHLFPKECPKLLAYTWSCIIIIILSFTILLPSLYFTYTELFFDILIPLIGIQTTISFIIAVYRKRENANIFLIGFILLFATVLNDLLYARAILFNGYYAPFGIFCFIFSQAFLLSTQFSQAFVNAEELTEELKIKNIELSKLDKLKDEFLANTSHELKTPLHGIIGIIDSIQKGNLGYISKEIKDNLSLAYLSAERLNKMISDILDFSVLKNDKMKINLQPIDTRSLIQLSVSLLSPIAKQKKLELIQDSNKDITIYADEDRILQVLLNLIGNAIKYTDKGEIKITSEVENNKAKIIIQDTGRGIPSEDLDRIFIPFEKTPISHNGSGLGLAICKDLIQLHGGDISVSSEISIGSKFFFTIPLYHGSSQIKTIEKEKYNLPNTVFNLLMEDKSNHQENHLEAIETAKSILITDDDPINIQILYHRLKKRGYKLLIAENGQKALDIIKTEKPDLAIVDIMMPVMNGLELCKKIREELHLIKLPIIILSAKNREEDIVIGLRTGANDYLGKPFSEEELIARIELHFQLQDINKTLEANNERLIDFNLILEKEVKERTKELTVKNEELEKANEFRDKLFSIISHDLRGPLGNIRNYLQYQYNKTKDAPSKEVNSICEKIGREIETTYSICDNTFQWAKSQLSVTKYDPSWNDIHFIITENIKIFSVIAQSKNIIIEPPFDIEQLPKIYFDINLINFVIRNILNNAVKFTKANGKITVEAKVKKDKLTLNVTDTGIGLTQKEIKSLFISPGSVKKDGTANEKGSGLGLWICNYFLELHSSKLKIKSKKNIGTTVSFELPIADLQSSLNILQTCWLQTYHGE